MIFAQKYFYSIQYLYTKFTHTDLPFTSYFSCTHTHTHIKYNSCIPYRFLGGFIKWKCDLHKLFDFHFVDLLSIPQFIMNENFLHWHINIPNEWKLTIWCIVYTSSSTHYRHHDFPRSISFLTMLFKYIRQPKSLSITFKTFILALLRSEESAFIQNINFFLRALIYCCISSMLILENWKTGGRNERGRRMSKVKIYMSFF